MPESRWSGRTVVVNLVPGFSGSVVLVAQKPPHSVEITRSDIILARHEPPRTIPIMFLTLQPYAATPTNPLLEVTAAESQTPNASFEDYP
jgi:hypothetical protein